MDVVVNNLDSRPSLFRNDGGRQSGSWLVIGLQGQKSNRSAIGTRVIAETDSGRQMQEVQGGSSYQACNDLRLHFGLGMNRIARSVSVRWPNGKTQNFDNVKRSEERRVGKEYRARWSTEHEKKK